MNKREKYLLTEAYAAGYLSASIAADNGCDPLSNDSHTEAEEWVADEWFDKEGYEEQDPEEWVTDASALSKEEYERCVRNQKN